LLVSSSYRLFIICSAYYQSLIWHMPST
jgi:hypothetical protein